jgi:plastocyanin
MRALGLALVVLVAATPSAAADRSVRVEGKLFVPDRLEVLVGDTVTWTNDDAVRHDVESDDGSFDSGDLESGESFSVTFQKPGRLTYLCSIHRFMRGEVDVFALSLLGPRRSVPVGNRFALHGLAPPEMETVTIERRLGSESFTPVASADVEPGGEFRTELDARASAEYRAVAGALVSSTLRVPVAAGIRLQARRSQLSVVLRISAAPAQSGAAFEVQVYAPERFSWVPIARGRLDAASRAHLALTLRRTRYVRISLRGVAGYGPGTSNVLVIRP